MMGTLYKITEPQNVEERMFDDELSKFLAYAMKYSRSNVSDADHELVRAKMEVSARALMILFRQARRER